MRKMSALVLGVLILAGAATAQDDNDKKIIGKWEITEAGGDAPKGTKIEFTKDGKLIAIIPGDKEEKLDGTYKIAKDKLTVEITVGGVADKHELTIKKLTDDALELEDKDKKTDKLKKLKDK